MFPDSSLLQELPRLDRVPHFPLPWEQCAGEEAAPGTRPTGTSLQEAGLAPRKVLIS